MLLADDRNPRSQHLADLLRRLVPPAAWPEDVHVVVGGDGFLLRCVRELGTASAYLGLNAGHLGFLLNDADLARIEQVAEAIAHRRWQELAVPRLSMRATLGDGRIVLDRALNDVYLERMTGQSAHLRLVVDDRVVVEHLACDGLVLATALGSTAYSYSAGGPACHPALRLVQLTAICPHRPRLHPVTLPPSARVRVQVLDEGRRPIRVVCDGVGLDGVREVEVVSGEDEVRLAWLDTHDATVALFQKLQNL